MNTLNSNLTFEYTSAPPNRQELPSAYPMQLKKYGRIVTATVTLLPATDISYAEDQIPLFVLPEKYRPVDGLSAEHFITNQKWLLYYIQRLLDISVLSN